MTEADAAAPQPKKTPADLLRELLEREGDKLVSVAVIYSTTEGDDIQVAAFSALRAAHYVQLFSGYVADLYRALRMRSLGAAKPPVGSGGIQRPLTPKEQEVAQKAVVRKQKKAHAS